MSPCWNRLNFLLIQLGEQRCHDLRLRGIGIPALVDVSNSEGSHIAAAPQLAFQPVWESGGDTGMKPDPNKEIVWPENPKHPYTSDLFRR